MRHLLLSALGLLVLAAVASRGLAEPTLPVKADAEERALLLDSVDQLRAEASRIRGLPWKFEVPADLLSREELKANMVEMVESEVTPEERERDTTILRRLGLIGPDEDPIDLMLEAMGDMVAGYYDPKEKRLFLIEGMTGEAQKPVILHELVHALEDQHMDLEKRLEPYEDDADRYFAEKCLGEGSAEHASALYMQANPKIAAAFRAGQRDPIMARRQVEMMSKVPAFLIVPTMLHYELGPEIVRRAVGDDFPAGIAALYDDPPVSQEQLLHPKKWFGERRDFPQEVTWKADFPEILGEGWSKVHDLSGGELDLAMFLDFFLGFTKGKVNLLLMQSGKRVVPRAQKAAEGWDGGRALFLLKEGLPAAWVEVLVFDTVDDATEAADALKDVLAKMNGDDFVPAVGAGFETSDERVRTLRYEGRHGAGRLRQDGERIYLADGLPADALERLWPVLLETQFEKDARDTWDPALVEDPLEGLDYVDRDHRLGLTLPGEGWEANEAGGRPGLVARVTKGGLRVDVSLIPAPMDTLLAMVEQQLRSAGFDIDGAVPRDVGEAPGRRYTGHSGLVYVGRAGGGSALLRVHGSQASVQEALEDLDRLAAGLVVAEE